MGRKIGVWLGLLITGVWLGQKFIPYLGFFPYKEELHRLPPAVLQPLGNFDGIHYLLIARQGYQQYEQAFFPLYPNLIKVMGNLPLVNGVLISVISFILGLFIWQKYFQKIGLPADKILWFWILFPTAFFFSTVYPESLFFLLMGLTLWLTAEKKWLLAILTGFLAAQTKLIGLALVIPIFWQNRKQWWIGLGPVAGFLSYCLYLWRTVGDPLAFYHAQPMFGANRATRLIFLPQVIWRYLKIFALAGHDFKYFIAILELVTLIGCLYLLCRKIVWRYWGLALFSLIVIILPTLTGTLSSLPRYALLAPAIFISLADRNNLWTRIVFGFLFAVLTAFFTQGYFVS
ncbi:MAG TPA: hypothetical protein P5299_02800 [Candidatus Woesebacteria bacterium]|nr:hypothetical protein [Candidatus Woesebacteria bacterium]